MGGQIMIRDMLVKLYDLGDEAPNLKELEKEGISIKRAMPCDKRLVTKFVEQNFSKSWGDESRMALSQMPTTCFIAVKDKKIIGFACYNTTGKNIFGPTGVVKEFRGVGIGETLLYKSLLAMREEGYAYAVIGWVSDAVEFYKKKVGAIEIPDSHPGIYSRTVLI